MTESQLIEIDQHLRALETGLDAAHFYRIEEKRDALGRLEMVRLDVEQMAEAIRGTSA